MRSYKKGRAKPFAREAMSAYYDEGNAHDEDGDEDEPAKRGVPAIPQYHPIIQSKLVEWEEAALRHPKNQDGYKAKGTRLSKSKNSRVASATYPSPT